MDVNSTRALVDTPVHNPGCTEQIQVTDPKHPLFGRKFKVSSRSATIGSPHGGHVDVIYGSRVLLRLPVSATSLTSRPSASPVCKLTPQAIEELIALVKESASTKCACGPNTSGSGSRKSSS